MSEERTQYTVHPDVLVRLETSEKYIKQLENTNDGYNMIQHRHAEMIAERDRRIAELEKTIARLEQEVIGYRLSAAVMEGAYITSDDAATKLKKTIARLEQEAQQRLDYTPVTLLRYIINTHPTVADDDRITARRWLDSLDGDA